MMDVYNKVQKFCPNCGSADIKPKGYVITKSLGLVRQLECRACKHRFRDRYCGMWKATMLPGNLLTLCHKKSISEIIKDLSGSVKVSRSTVYLEIQRRLQDIPDWRKLLYDEEVRRMWGGIMGIDTTKINVGNEEHTYLHVADNPSGLPLAYQVLERETATLITAVLQEVRHAGYWPRLIVTDLAAELLDAVRGVFPKVPIQACPFHLLRWLNEQLPTKRKKLPPWQRAIRVQIKKKIIMAALALTVEDRREIMESLCKLQSNLVGAERQVIEQFASRLEAGYYHTLKELAALSCEPRYAYNNVCERSMEFVKDLERRMRGFKKTENVQGYINLLWYYRIKERIEKPSSIEYWNSKHMAKQILELASKGIVDIVNLEDTSRITKIPLDIIRNMSSQLGLVTVSKFAFSARYMRRLYRTLLRKKPATIKEAAVVVELDTQTIVELLPRIGLKIRFRALDPANIYIVYPESNFSDTIMEDFKSQSYAAPINLMYWLKNPS